MHPVIGSHKKLSVGEPIFIWDLKGAFKDQPATVRCETTREKYIEYILLTSKWEGDRLEGQLAVYRDIELCKKYYDVDQVWFYEVNTD